MVSLDPLGPVSFSRKEESVKQVNGGEPRLLYRMEDVAHLLNISRSKAFEMAAAGKLPGVVRLGRSVRVSRIALERWIQEKEAPTDDVHETAA